jgi:hypothetical protein
MSLHIPAQVDGPERFNFLFILHFFTSDLLIFLSAAPLLTVSVATQPFMSRAFSVSVWGSRQYSCLPSTEAAGRDLIASIPV